MSAAACPTCGHVREQSEPRRSWTATIDERVKSQNAHLVNVGHGRWAYARHRNVWQQWMRARFPPDARGAEQKRRVTIVRRYSGREREFDYANMVGGCKPVVDAIKLAGLIVDDSPRWLEDRYEQVRADRSETVITIEEW